MDSDYAISLQDVTLEIPARRRISHRAKRETSASQVSPTQIGGRLSFGRGSSTTVTILDGVNIAISRGQRVGLIGANGAGKSTLLRVMAGIYHPTRGVAETRGTISTLFPELMGVRPDATGLENILLTGVLLGLTKKEISRRIPEIIEFTELGDYIYMPIRTYSTGMRTRLVLSIATCIRPDILLVDEVIGVGDKSFRLKAKDRLNEMMTSANTLVVVSQSPEIIREFCTEAIWLERGQVRTVGDVDEVLRAYVAHAAGTNAGMASDSEALLAIRDRLAGDGSLNWSADVPITSWDGVTVGGNPTRVTRLILRDSQLRGSLPRELGNLAELSHLDLRNNRLNGEIPAELGRLSKLVILDLHGNDLEGPIPPELGELSDLKVLNLHSNRLSGPVTLELCQIASLEGLYLHNNRLSGTIPGELGKLRILDNLWLSNNRLSGEVPAELGNLTDLTKLSLHGNQLSGALPSELGNLGESLQFYRLGGNNFVGCLPTGLASVADTDLRQLDLPVCSDN